MVPGLGCIGLFRYLWVCPECGGFLGTLHVDYCPCCSHALGTKSETIGRATGANCALEFSKLLETEQHARVRAHQIVWRGAPLLAALFALVFFSTKASYSEVMAWILSIVVGIAFAKSLAYLSYLVFVAKEWRCPSCRKALPSPYQIEVTAIKSCASCGITLK